MREIVAERDVVETIRKLLIAFGTTSAKVHKFGYLTK